MTHRDKLLAELHALGAIMAAGAHKSVRRTQLHNRVEAILAFLYGDDPDA